MNNVIVVSTHPDDEMFGVGGTLLKHAENNDSITWVIITSIFEDQGFSKERIASREQEIEKVANGIGIENVVKLGFPTMSLDSSSLKELIPLVADVFQKYKPNIVYTLNRSDVHSDHRITFDAIFSCTKSFRFPFIKKVLMYECVSETEFAPALSENVFIPNYFVDISKYIEKKIELASVYESEMGEHPFPRSNENLKALATFRGATAGVEYAEAFHLLKYIDK